MQPLSYLQTTGGLIWTIACAVMGILITWGYYTVINRIPASWLCDYGETPSEELLSGKRVNYARSGIIMSIVTAACLVLCRLQFNKGYDIYFGVFSLIIVISLMIAVCDIKYTIIPDQFTIALAVLALGISIYDLVRGFGLLHKAWWSPLAGAAMGAGAMILIDLIGVLIYKKDGMGFGDVKLFGAIGLLTGFPGTILAFAISVVCAMVCFIVIIIVVKIMVRKAAAGEAQSLGEEASGVAEEQKEASAHEPSGEGGATDRDEPEEEASGSEEAAAEDSPGEDAGDDSDGGGSYLAFGPYIAVSLICYIVFNDFLYHMVEQYLSLFK